MARIRPSQEPEIHPVIARAVGAVAGATAAAACSGVAFLIFNVMTGAKAGGGLGAYFARVAATVGGLLGSDERLALIFLPLLIFTTLLLGGLYLWNKRGD